MSFIRTKDGIYEVVGFDNECIIPSKLVKVKTNGRERITHCCDTDIIKQADTIEELCDEVVCEQTHTLMRPYFKKHDDEGFPDETYHEGIVNAIRKGHFNAKNFDWFGAIWTTGDNGEPILKSVTKLKGILPNGEIDWELI